MKKINLIGIIIAILINILSMEPKAIVKNTEPIRAGVLLYKGNDYFISLVRNKLIEIENQNKDRIQFIIYDGDGNQDLQDKQLAELIKDKVDVIFLNIVNINNADKLLEEIKKSNIPVIFFNREPLSLNGIKEYTNKAIYIGTTACESGNMQGDVVIKEWRDKGITDKNKDNTIQYFLLQGDKDNLEAQYRSECVIRRIEENDIKTSKIAEEFCNWDRACAKQATEKLFSQYGKEIELIISNNDEMAIGAILALQENGYNLGDPQKYISVIGVDGTEQARQMIENGFMTGTVIQDSDGMATALYRIGSNLAEGKPALQDTDYKFDVTGVGIRIPYEGYLIRSSLR